MLRKFFNTHASYGPFSKFFHWVMAFFVILMLSASYFIGDIPDKLARGITYNAHKLVGLTILFLIVLRFIWALINPRPLSLNVHSWERFAEKLVHWLLYLSLISMPLAGWIGSVAGGRAPSWRSITFNLPIEKNEWLSDLAFSIHNNLAIFIIVLVSLHTLAALYHHFIRKDKTLERMLP